MGIFKKLGGVLGYQKKTLGVLLGVMKSTLEVIEGICDGGMNFGITNLFYEPINAKGRLHLKKKLKLWNFP